MSDYIVSAFATYHASIRVEADSPEEAREIARRMTVHELDFDCHDLFEFEVEESHTPEVIG